MKMLYISFNLILHQFNAISRWFFLHWKILFQWVLIKCFLKIKMENKLIPVSFRLDQYMHFGLHQVQDTVSLMVYCLWFNSWNGFQWRVKRLNSHCSWNALMFAAPVQICTPVHVKENRCMLLCCVVICEGNTIKWRFLIFVIYIIKIICPLELSWVFAACASSTAQCSDFATAGDRGTAVHRAATHNGD